MKRKILTVFIVCVFAITARAQNSSNSIATAFNSYNASILREKVFVHTDKSFYVSGEIIWFKVYDVKANDNTASDLSKVAYVEILDSSNKAVLQAKVAIENGTGNGSFYLPVSFTTGNYIFRAYTNWMKNFGASYFFQKNITVVNTQKVLAQNNIDSNKYAIQFFPEGGDIVNGLQSKIGFRATDAFGKGIEFKGFIIDNSDTVLQFSPVHAGIGNFVFTPQKDHNYNAYIITANGSSFTQPLPAVQSAGYAMSVASQSDNINVHVTSTDATQDVYMLVHSSKKVIVAAGNALQNGSANFSINSSALPDGISYITIFNSNKQPVCERLYFKRPAAQLVLTAQTNNATYTTREKVSLIISTASTIENTDSANLSLSIYKLDSLQAIDENNISNYLLLTSDLKGYIEDPDYYFSANSKEVNDALDNLLLVNGWRRFDWNNILQNNKPYFTYPPEYNGHIVSAKVIDTKTNQPAANIETFASAPGSRTLFSAGISDAAGNVQYEMKDFYNATDLVVEPNLAFYNNYRVDINNPFSTDFSDNQFPKTAITASFAKTLEREHISMQVQNIYNSNTLKKFGTPNIDTASFYRHPDASYDLDNYTRFTTIEEVLREYVVSVDVTRKEGKVHLPVFDSKFNKWLDGDPLVMIDGVPVFDLNKFFAFDPLKLKKIDVITTRYYFGNFSFSGLLNCKTYNGDLAGYELDPGAVMIDYDGLQLQREFYSPVYETQEQRTSHIPDFRNVLLWQPDLILHNAENKTINFYSSDLQGRYVVFVQGITQKGLPGKAITTFTVSDKK